MLKKTVISSLIGLALASSGVAAAAPAQNGQSQDNSAAASSKSAQKIKTIIVTGSALPRIDVETPSPVTVITAAKIRESGLTTVSDVIRAISADNSGSIPTSFTAGFAGGAAGVALRGLTVNSTLVLIDGQRVANYALADDGERSFVDLNSIPVNAIERIEVLKDGASSLYGADAIGGVVNVILRKDYQGAQGSVQVGTSQHGGGFQKRATVMAGTGNLEQDGHNLYFSAEFESDNAIKASQRGFPFNTSDLSSIGGLNNDIGQPYSNGSTYGTVTPATLGTPGDLLTGQAIPGAKYQTLRACGNDSTSISGASGTYCQQDPTALFGEIQPKVKRAGFYARFTQKLDDQTQIYMDAMYYQDKVTSTGAHPQIQAGTPVNTNSIALPPTLTDGLLNPNDPFASQGQYALINYAFGDINGGAETANHNLRLTSGLSTMWNDWHIKGGVVLNHTWLDVNNYGFLNYNQLMKDVQDGSYNFIDPSKNTPQVLQALAPVLNKRSTTDLDSLDIQASNELMDLPGGALGFAIGAQWRYEAQRDPSLNPGSAALGLGNAKTIGRRNVGSLYAELDAPVLESLEVDVSGRYDHYSDFGSNFSPKIGFKWQPFDMIAIRGTYSKGFRAPSFSENGSSSSEGFVTYTPPAAFIAQHGDATNPYVKPYGLAEYTTANPKIKPEKSRSYTFGVLFQPTDNISASVDYYDIKKTGVIAQQSPGAALAAYYAGQPIPAGYAITLDSPDPLYPNAPARPLVVEAPYVNENALQTKGVDLDLQGHFQFGNGIGLHSELSGTKIISWTETLADGTVQHFVGTHGPYALSSGAGTPRYRASWSNSLSYGPATVTGTLYYTSGLYLSIPDYLPHDYCFSTGAQGQNLPSNCRLPSFTYFNLTGSYRLNDHVELTASVLNLFDRKAGLDTIDYATGSNYNPTWNQAGAVGRFYTVGVRVKM